MKRFVLLLCLVLLPACMLWALDGTVTWFWFENDPDVEFYRYQVDGEDEDGWTILDWYVNEITISLDVSVPHTFYLQQSYDGEAWSEASFTDSDILEQSVQEQEVMEDEEAFTEPEVTEEESSEPEEEVPAAVAVLAEAEKRKSIDLGPGYLNFLPSFDGSRMLGVDFAFSDRLLDLGPGHAGFRTNAAVFAGLGKAVVYANALATYDFKVGKCDLFLGVGPDVMYSNAVSGAFHGGIACEGGIFYNRSDSLRLGLVFTDHAYLVPYTAYCNFCDVRVFYSIMF